MGKTVKVYANVTEGYVSFSNVTTRQEEWLKQAEKDLSDLGKFASCVLILATKFPNDSDLGREIRSMLNKYKNK